MAMSNEIATLNHEIMRRAPYLRDLLPKEITPERLRTFVMTTLAQNDALSKCSNASLLGAVYASAKVGIEPDGVLACIVPRKGKAQYQLMYRGAVALAQRSGLVANVWAETVHANDPVFDVRLGSDPRIVHEPALGNRGEITAVYACARFTDGHVQFRVLTREEVMKARSISQTKDRSDGPWKQHEAEMWRKTAVHRLCKLLPLPGAVQAVLDADEAGMQGREQGLDAEWSAIQVDEPGNGGRVRESTIDVEAKEPDAIDDQLGTGFD